MVKKAVMDEGAFMCSVCGAIVHEDANVCYQCSAPLEGSFRAVICAACGSIVASDRELCSVCGVEIRTGGGPKKVPVLDKDILGIVDEIKSQGAEQIPAPQKIQTVVPTGVPGDATMELMDALKSLNKVWESMDSAREKRDWGAVDSAASKGAGLMDELLEMPMRLDLMMQSRSGKASESGGVSEELRKKEEYANRRLEELRQQVEALEKEKVKVRERTQVLDSRERSVGDREKVIAEREAKGGAGGASASGLDRHRKMLKQILMFNQSLKSPEGLKNVAALSKAVQEFEALLPKDGQSAPPDGDLTARETEIERHREDLETREKALAAERERLAAKEDSLRESERSGSAESYELRKRLEVAEHELAGARGETERLQGMLNHHRDLQDAQLKWKETEELLESELKSRVEQVKAHEAERARLEGEAQSMRQELGLAKEKQGRLAEDLEAARAELMKTKAMGADQAAGSQGEESEAQLKEMRARMSAISAALGLQEGSAPDGEAVRNRLTPLEEAEMVRVLKALDDLLGRLPEAEIDEFANSVVFPLYEKLTDRYGI
jgi:RNA polymerase subunit RPABC4/transcription elongation factor Spt4